MRWIVLTLTLAISFPTRGMAQTPGWARVALPSGGYAQRYLPHSVRPCDPLPLVLFLHGAGGTPEGYESYVEADAESLGVVLIMPAATGAGWGGADDANISAALDAIGSEVNVDGTRTYFAGHSAGAAYAYILAYTAATGVAAVFTLSAPAYPVSAPLSEPTYRAPIHMYYGDTDPNYTMGGEASLISQWNSLGIPHEEDIEAGFGHSNWPDSSMLAGFTFLLAHHYPGTPPASTCAGGSDAGTPIDAGGTATDAGHVDGGSPLGDAGSGGHDAASGSDLGTGHGGARGGCGCSIPNTADGRGCGVGLAGLLFGAFALRRRGRHTQRWT